MKDLDFLLDERVRRMHAALCKVMSNPRRIRLIHLLQDGEMSVGEMVDSTGMRKAAVSQNLAIMKGQNLVQARRDGQKIYYSLRAKKLLSACDALEELLREMVTLEIEKG